MKSVPPGRAAVDDDNEDIALLTLARTILNSNDYELYQLAILADIRIDPQIFKVVMSMVLQDVSAGAIITVLKSLMS